MKKQPEDCQEPSVICPSYLLTRILQKGWIYGSQQLCPSANSPATTDVLEILHQKGKMLRGETVSVIFAQNSPQEMSQNSSNNN